MSVLFNVKNIGTNHDSSIVPANHRGTKPITSIDSGVSIIPRVSLKLYRHNRMLFGAWGVHYRYNLS